MKNLSWGTKFWLTQKRELDPREKTRYERYCEWCESLDCRPASEQVWRLENHKLANV